jgi:streptomycin 6-kinase
LWATHHCNLVSDDAETMEEPPTQLARNVELYLGEDGARWLVGLPQLVHRVSERWSLSVGPPFRDLSYSYVAPATRADGTRYVLKLGAPNTEVLSEIEALRYWDGDAAVRLLEAEPHAGALPLERVEPGAKLFGPSHGGR